MENKDQHYVALQGSYKNIPFAKSSSILNSDETIEVSVLLRRKKSIDDILSAKQILTHEEYENNHGLSLEDVSLIETFTDEYHISVSHIAIDRRTVKLFGRIRDFEDAFQVKLAHYVDDKSNLFRGRVGEIFIPAHLEGIIEGIFGLDNRPIAKTHHRVARQALGIFSEKAAFTGLNPRDVAKAYGFPMDYTGKGQCIAIIELGGGYSKKTLTEYFTTLGVHAPKVKSVSVDGGKNHPTGNPNGPDGEVMLDIEVAGAIANGASIAVYFAPNTDQGFLDAISAAIHDKVNKPSVVSISWGGPESSWTTQSLNNYNEVFKAASVLGVTICAAAGDDGSGDGAGDQKVHVDFPSSSPYVLACGGTKLTLQNGQVALEVVWNEDKIGEGATGGGVSEFFALPDYQSGIEVPLSLSTKFKGRGLPDVAGNADPESGFFVQVDKISTAIGGTSAVAPLMAALIALINEKKGSPVGFIHPALYASPADKARDISTGDNTSNPPGIGYKAGEGWDPCTGWGVLYNL